MKSDVTLFTSNDHVNLCVISMDCLWYGLLVMIAIARTIVLGLIIGYKVVGILEVIKALRLSGSFVKAALGITARTLTFLQT